MTTTGPAAGPTTPAGPGTAGDQLNGGLPEGRLVPLPDADLYVYELGRTDGPPVVLLHGFLTDSYTWRDVVPALATDHRVILVDLPGSGRSPDPRGKGWTADRCVDLLASLFDVLSLAAPTLVGSQMGGSLGAWFAAARPARVGRLVVMAAGVLGETSANLTLYKVLANPLIGGWASRYFPRGGFEEKWQAAHGPGHRVDPAATDRYFAQIRARGRTMARVGLDIRRSFGKSFDALTEPLRGLAVPTLLLFGDRDPLVPVSTGQRFADLIPGATLLVLPLCGDFPQEERPVEVAAAIRAFLGTDPATDVAGAATGDVDEAG
ncbi:alpha/beta fold hydrolase [Frankia sp. CiP3]|uniref:alpha/beta fold hydrolase n=1 Tax=Frankia sp. CiP3 TaxID=2880971 RepID=UPI001EF53D86|nr:alpha/beta hydrolase [Frankia sp. CiP3]